MKTKMNLLMTLVSTVVLAFAVPSIAAPQTAHTNNIAASPRLQQMLNERPAPKRTNPAPASATKPASCCAKACCSSGCSPHS